MRAATSLLWSCVFVGTTVVTAFSSSKLGPPLLMQRSSGLIINARPSSTTRLFSDSFDDDEISKLIGKRSEIKRKKKSPQEEENVDISLSSSAEDLDLEKMPEFKTKRQARAPKPSSDDDKTSSRSAAGDDEQSGMSGPEFLDYRSEYEDENDLHIPNRIGFSTAAWGDEKRGFVSGGKLTKKMIREGKFVPGDLQAAYNNLLESGVSFVETSEAYGAASRSSKLSAEDVLSRCMEENDSYSPLVASTLSSPWTGILSNGVRFGSKSVLKALKASCSRMDTSSVELYQVPKTLFYPGLPGALADGVTLALDKGYCNYVGVCNVGRGGMKSFARKLEKRGATLTSNQFEFSLTKRGAWKSGLIDACKDLGVIPLVSNPLDGGLATGKYTATNPSGGETGGQGRYSFKQLEKMQPLHSVQETVAEKAKNRVKREMRDIQERYRRYGPAPKINTDITTTQVAINYVLAKGAVPLLEVNGPKQVEELTGCLGWGLSEEEVEMLDAAASLCGY